MFVDCTDDRRARRTAASGGRPHSRPIGDLFVEPHRSGARCCASWAHAGSGVFVGRDREFAGVVQRLDLAGTGQGATVLVTGDAGIGKTRTGGRGRLSMPAPRVSRCCLAGRSTSSGWSCRSNRSSTRCVRSGTRLVNGSRGRSCTCSSRRWRCCRSGPAITPCWSCWRIVHWADVSTPRPRRLPGPQRRRRASPARGDLSLGRAVVGGTGGPA